MERNLKSIFLALLFSLSIAMVPLAWADDFAVRQCVIVIGQRSSEVALPERRVAALEEILGHRGIRDGSIGDE